ncbi:nucleotide disphospho-sugar-binding domain-containing protein, partial [Streptomyces sp. NPDC001274]
DPAELGEIPANVEVHSWVPQLAILEQADAFVTHAGMGGSSEGLYAGVPMIAVPQSADQPTNADRLVELGVARRIDTEDATAEALRTALLELTADPEVARRSARLRADARAEGGTQRAADLIEEMLDRG